MTCHHYEGEGEKEKTESDDEEREEKHGLLGICHADLQREGIRIDAWGVEPLG